MKFKNRFFLRRSVVSYVLDTTRFLLYAFLFCITFLLSSCLKEQGMFSSDGPVGTKSGGLMPGELRFSLPNVVNTSVSIPCGGGVFHYFK